MIEKNMRKDVKTGMITGAAMCLVAALIISIWPGRKHKPGYTNIRQTEQYINTLVSTRDSTSSDQTNETEEIPEIPLSIHPKKTVPIETVYQFSEKDTEKEATPKTVIHIVTSGDTLSSISERYYQSSGKWKLIVDANPKVIQDGETIVPGMKLKIPLDQ